MKQEALTQYRLKELLSYDQDTGVFTWKNSSGRYGRIPAGTIAGTLDKSSGYIRIRFGCTRYLAHRLAWLFIHGKFPANQLDHINGIGSDNRISNLREATQSENNQNRVKNKNNTSGYLGVSYNNKLKKWQATIGFAGKNKNLGYFDTPEMADKAYRLYKAQIHTFNPIVRET